MGWYYGWLQRKSLVGELTRTLEREDGNKLKRIECLRHCYRGNRHSGVLWSLWEASEVVDGVREMLGRYINCDMLQCRGWEWGYKGVSEGMHPLHFSCPLAYLEATPREVNDDFNQEWRDGVVAHHARSLERRRAKANAKKQLQAFAMYGILPEPEEPPKPEEPQQPAVSEVLTVSKTQVRSRQGRRILRRL